MVVRGVIRSSLGLEFGRSFGTMARNHAAVSTAKILKFILQESGYSCYGATATLWT